MRRTTTRTIATLGVVTLAAAGLALPAQADDAPTTLLTETFGDASAPGFTRLGHGGLTNAPDGSSWAPQPGHDLKHPATGSFLAAGDEIAQEDARRGAPQPGESGAFQLTDNNHDKSGGVVYNHAQPTSGGLDISFQQRQYNSSTRGTSGGRFPHHTTGADGIAFFITDGSVELTRPGAYGGSLGYAQKTTAGGGGADIPGVAGGYLGVGLDVLGNYASANEGRIGGKNTTWLGAPNSVTLRGPESTGYRYLTSAPTQLEGDWKTVRVTVTPEEYPTVTVSVNGTKVIDYTMTTPMPETFKFGFTGSTGDLTDVHLVRMLDVRTIQPLPEPETPGEIGPTNPSGPDGPTTPGDEEELVQKDVAHLVVRHVDEDGHPLRPDTTSTSAPGSDYDTAPATIDGYRLVTTPDNAAGSYGADGSTTTVTYVYAKIAATALAPDPAPPVDASPDPVAERAADTATGPAAGGRLASTGALAVPLAALAGVLTLGGALAVLVRRLAQQER